MIVGMKTGVDVQQVDGVVQRAKSLGFQVQLNLGTDKIVIAILGGNTGQYVYVGNDGAGDVTSSNGYQLKKGLDSILMAVTNLNQLYLDADTDGDGVCWHRVAAENPGVTPPTA